MAKNILSFTTTIAAFARGYLMVFLIVVLVPAIILLDLLGDYIRARGRHECSKFQL